MHPILFKIGPLTLYTYGCVLALAFLSAITFMYYEEKREGIETERLADLTFFIILSGIIGARILYILMYPAEYITQPWKIFMVWEGGLVFYGGIIGAMATTIYLLKKYNLPFWQTMDVLAPALVLAQGIGRIGCFMAGCCYGRAACTPWAVTFTDLHTLAPIGTPVHPVQLYHSLANFIIFFILFIILRRKRSFTGQVACLYLFLYPLGRFITEFFRGDSLYFILGHLNLTQILSIVIFLGSIYLYFLRKRTCASP